MEFETKFTESLVEEAALSWLEGLGYVIKHGPDIAPGNSSLSGAIWAKSFLRTGAGREGFKPWRTVTGEALADPHIPELQVLIADIFHKRRFFDLK